MVRIYYALIILLSSASVNSAENDTDTLRSRLEGDNKNNSVKNRLRSSNYQTMKLLSSEDMTYKLPNGRFVQGILLPNGKVAPAMVDRYQKRSPACVTKEMKLVQGEYNQNTQKIECKVDPSELAIIEGQKGAQAITSTKYGGGGAQPQTAVKNTNSINPNIYIPPARNTQAKANTVAGVMDYNKQEFGVPIGTWVSAKLLRSVSSAESGMIEFETLEDIEGKRQVFPTGTILFAQKRINEGQKRLESQTMTARLPNGEQIENIIFMVYSLDKTAGLNGKLIRDHDGELVAATSSAALSAVGTAAVGGNNSAAGAAANSFTGDMIGNERRYAPNNPRAIIKVSQQRVLLQSIQKF